MARILQALLLGIVSVPLSEAWTTSLRAPPARSFLTRLSSSTVNGETSEGGGGGGGDAVAAASTEERIRRARYDLGIGKHKPYGAQLSLEETSSSNSSSNHPIKSVEAAGEELVDHWIAHTPAVQRSPPAKNNNTSTAAAAAAAAATPFAAGKLRRTKRLVVRNEESRRLRSALWDEHHFHNNKHEKPEKQPKKYVTHNPAATPVVDTFSAGSAAPPKRPSTFYPDIDLSIPQSVYADDGSVDLIWDLLRWEAYQQAQAEPLLVSFLHSTILNHPSMESSLAFLLANRLQSPGMMISTQLQSVILDALQHNAVFRRCLRADMMAVRDRDPACNYLPDVFLYFKGFHALQSHRVANCLWRAGKQVQALFLQSQVSQIFQIDIHPNATLGSGILVDHGTGVVIGSTASVGHNCSILHHVTLGGSGKKGVDRHPKVGNGVLLGAGATVLGPVRIGDGCQIGAGTLVISDLPAHSVAVGVPARIIGSFVDVTEQPSLLMNQIMDDSANIITFESDGI